MIDAVAVEKRYGDIAALTQVSLHVPSHTVFGLVGPNGAGKSTLFRVLCGLARPDRGSVRLAGHDPIRQARDAKRTLGCVPELLPLFELLSGDEQLVWLGRLQGLSDTTIRTRATELSAALDLGSALPRRISTYSRGMRQKLSFVGALIHDPRVIVLDEPFEGVDILAVRAMKAMIRQFAAAGAAVLLSSHILPLVEDVCDCVGIISAGQMVFEGDRDAVRREAGRLAERGAGGALETVFLSLIAPNVRLPRLQTVATSEEVVP